MMDYCSRANTYDDVEQVPVGNMTVMNSVQETRKILGDLNMLLNEFEDILYGPDQASRLSTVPKDSPNCLLEETKYVTGLAYDCLSKARRIKESVL